MAKKPFVVLDAEILSSSVWSEAAHVRLVWITLLILCDTDGEVGASVPGIASAAGVTLEQAEDAIRRLQEPDPYSRTKAKEGRRLEVIERGFRILNFHEHLDRLSAERTKARERVRRFRERRNSNVTKTDGNVTVRSGKREQGVGTREKGRTDALSLPSMQQGGSAEGGIDRIALRLTLTNQFPREKDESIEVYRQRIDTLLEGNGVCVAEPGTEG